MSNPFVHLELCTSDTAKAKEFYTNLFGWNFTDNDMGGMIYSTFKPDSGPGGGLFSMPDMPTFWLAYVGVDDINAATDKAKSLGASIHKGPMESHLVVPLRHPTGATIALFRPAPCIHHAKVRLLLRPDSTLLQPIAVGFAQLRPVRRWSCSSWRCVAARPS